jgi:hypothetical protein
VVETADQANVWVGSQLGGATRPLDASDQCGHGRERAHEVVQAGARNEFAAQSGQHLSKNDYLLFIFLIYNVKMIFYVIFT